MVQKHRLMTLVHKTGKVFISPLVYSEEEVKLKLNKLIGKKKKKLLHPERCTCVSFPINHYPKISVYKEKYADLSIERFHSLIKASESAWRRGYEV